MEDADGGQDLLNCVRLDDNEGGEWGDKLVSKREEKCAFQVVANHWHPHPLLLLLLLLLLFLLFLLFLPKSIEVCSKLV